MIMLSKLLNSAVLKNVQLQKQALNSINKVSKQFCCNDFLKVCSVNFATKPTHETKQSAKNTFDGDRVVLSSLLKARKNFRKKTVSFLQKHSAQAYVDKSPQFIKPYLQLIRADKPIGTLLLYFPCAFSICLAAQPGSLPDFYYLGLFGLGAFLMRGAGCIINDLWDQNIDKMVERTKHRPLASGAISRNNALMLLAGHLTLSLGILSSLNSTCVAIGFASMIPVILYPLAKRHTDFPQLVLGLTFNIGAIMGYAAVTGSIDWSVIGPLYGSCIAWTIYYDSIYAFQDVNDDMKIGVRSVATFFSQFSLNRLQVMDVKKRLDEEKKRQTTITIFLWSTCSVHFMLFAMAGVASNALAVFYLALGCSFLRTFEEIHRLNIASKDQCWKAFNGIKWHGVMLLIGIVSSTYLN